MKISAFPKCYIDDIALRHTMTLFEWIDMARSLGAEGLEMYDGFFESLDNAYIDKVGDALVRSGFAMPMLCNSPDFTNPDADGRQRAIERSAELIRVTRRLGGPHAACRVLSGQRYPQVSLEQGTAWVIDCITQLLPVAHEYDVVLAMENHYKDGFWQYPEFAQKQEVFLAIVNAISDQTHFGVQYDPSNAIVAGDDPIDLLRHVISRVVTMHASDRYLAEGATLADLKQADGTLGYSPSLRHGVTGKGLNNYPLIFSMLASVGYKGWVSIEDGMNGMDEMRQSIDFLMLMRDKFF
ncbi:MAG TPA: sugar phosphate isomerase/epimerase family protein [Anaerolineae bacterium]